MELKPCPFCNGIKLKIDSKKSSGFRYIDGKKEENHVVTVRCNKCHTRGPTVSVWLPSGHQYDSIKAMQKEVIDVWNHRAS